jgi:hypothetical protein
LRKLLKIIGILGVVVLVAGGAFCLLFTAAFSDSFKGGFLLSQDCNGTSIRFSGRVQGVSAGTISVKGENGLYGGSGAVDLTLTTDANGGFDSGRVGLPVFVCEILRITISAEGFVPQHLNYVLLDHFSEAELGTSMAKGNMLPVVLDIELQRSK